MLLSMQEFFANKSRKKSFFYNYNHFLHFYAKKCNKEFKISLIALFTKVIYYLYKGPYVSQAR